MKKLKIFKKKEKKLKKSYRSSVFLWLSGYNLERYLNQLSAKGINFFYIEKINLKESIVEVSSSDEKNVEKFFKSKNIVVTQKKYNGFSKLKKIFKARFGIFVGALICLCFFAISSGFVWRIEVYGNERILTEEIEQVLSDNGVSFLSSLNSKSNFEIEKILMDNFEDVSMVSVVKKGCSIIVNIKEKVVNDEYENIDTASAVVATEDGIITEIQLISGTLLVKVGDVVRAGDVLVAPYIIDSSGQQIPTIAKANIFANVSLSGQVVFEAKKEITKRTGNFVVERKMTFLDKEIVTSRAEIPYLLYELEVQETLLSDYLLPITYTTTTYYELEQVTVEADFESERESLVQEAKNLAGLRLNENDVVVEENSVVTEQDGKIFVNYVYIVTRNISG